MLAAVAEVAGRDACEAATSGLPGLGCIRAVDSRGATASQGVIIRAFRRVVQCQVGSVSVLKFGGPGQIVGHVNMRRT